MKSEVSVLLIGDVASLDNSTQHSVFIFKEPDVKERNSHKEVN